MRNGPELPDACIRCVIDRECALAHGLKLFKLGDAGLRKQPVIEKGLRDAEYDLAVNIVLYMFGGLITPTHRS